MADKIVYHQDPFFKKIMAAQKGPLPYPDALRAEIDALKEKVVVLEAARVAYTPVEVQPVDANEPNPVHPAREVADEEAARAEQERQAEAAAGIEGAQNKVVPLQKPTLAREVAQEVHGANDTRSLDEIKDAIRPKIKSAEVLLGQINARLADKGVAGIDIAEDLKSDATRA